MVIASPDLNLKLELKLKVSDRLPANPKVLPNYTYPHEVDSSGSTIARKHLRARR
jgi:hypothetical protein